MDYNTFLVKFLCGLGVFCFAFKMGAQTVNIPDQNFKNALLNYTPTIDTNNDGEIQVSEAQVVTTLDVSGKGIQDLTGIADFVNITVLNCNSNLLTTLDFGQNTALVSLRCKDNQLTSLDVSQNTLLEFLHCGINQLTSLDVSQCAGLQDLFCYSNQLTNIDVSQNTELKSLDVSFNPLSTLDVAQNTKLEDLGCSSCQLTSLDLSQNINLEVIACQENQLTALDVSNNTSLHHFNCADNSITSMDLTQNTILSVFLSENNALTFLDVRNGNNTNIGLFDTQDNPNLKCIFVDNATYSENHVYWFRDPASTYVETQAQCDALGTKDLAFRKILVYPNPVSSRFYIITPQKLQLEKVVVYDVLGNKVKTFAYRATFYDVSGMQNGLYFVKIVSGDKSLTRKIIKK